ncbi:MAG: Rossmann-like and DUF2520 domain-containing protein [Candidatus Acidiferrales bacterium]
MSATIAIIGAGRVGRALGRRLKESGWKVGAVISRTPASAHAAVRAIGAGSAHAKLSREILEAQVILVTTPDDVVDEVARRLAKMGGEEWREKVALHTSGALDRSALGPLAELGAATGSLHPMQTFGKNATPRLEGVVFGIEGDARARQMARKIAHALGGTSVVLKGRDKPAYHAAGAMAAGHGLALVETATEILMRVGFTRRRATQALVPLVRQMLQNFERMGPREAWSGPLSRRDYRTIAKHATALRSYPAEFWEAYAAVARLVARVLSPEPAEMLARLDKILK